MNKNIIFYVLVLILFSGCTEQNLNTNDQNVSSFVLDINVMNPIISNFLYDNYKIWNEEAEENDSQYPVDVLVSLADITFDGVPELFCGPMDMAGVTEYYAYSLTDNRISPLDLHFSGSPLKEGDFLCGQIFSKKDGSPYFYNIATWGPITQSYFLCTEFCYSYDLGEWNIETKKFMDSSFENRVTYEDLFPVDKSTYLANTSIYIQSYQFNNENIESIIQDCIKNYYSVNDELCS